MSHHTFLHHYLSNKALNFTLSYTPKDDFPRFLTALQQKEQREWTWLIAAFRNNLVPYLRKNTQLYPKSALLSRDQFIEEVIEETLLKFYQIFEKGSFEVYENLEAALITTAGYKLKEGFARLRKEQKIYFMEGEALGVMRERVLSNEERADLEQAEKVAKIKEQLNRLDSDERQLLTRFFAGEELRDIADDLNISPAACRKRKQRVVERLKSMVLKAFTLVILLLS